MIERRGSYDKVPLDEYTPRFYAWAKEQKVMPGFYPMAIYHDAPGARAPGEFRSDIAITFKGRAKATEGIVLKRLPATRVATISHKGPESTLGDTYARLNEWIDNTGFEASGPPMKIYSRKPKEVGGVTTLYAKVMVPVR